MVRNQFYILIIGVIVIILLGYIYQISIFSKEISNYVSYYSSIARFMYLKAFLEKYQKFFYLDESIAYPIKVVYDCSNNSISIPNYLNLENISIFDNKFNYLPTSFDNNYINFTIFEREIYKDNYCIFEGYLIQNEKFSTSHNIKGNYPIYYVIYPDKKINISGNVYKKIINNFIREISIDFDGNCTEINYINPNINLKLNSLSLNNINLYYQYSSLDTLTLVIENVGNCPVDIRNFLYETDKIYRIIPGLNVNSTSFVIYPGKSEIFNLSNFYGTFCLNSLGFKKCIELYLLLEPNYYSFRCSIPGFENIASLPISVYVGKDIKNPVKLYCNPNCYFNPDTVYPGYNNIFLTISYICPVTSIEIELEIIGEDTITKVKYPANNVKIIIEGTAI